MMNSSAILKGLQSVTRDWTTQKKREERESSARHSRRDRLCRKPVTTIRSVAFSVMKDAYLKASANGTLPAHARQIMYAARGPILERTGRRTLDDAYFTQALLPEYIRDHRCDDWDVVYDARGHFQEPHAFRGEEVALGTLNVREYLNEIEAKAGGTDPPGASVIDGGRYPTRGPRNRYGAILFVEKEGFMPLFEKVSLADRFDLAIMSTKGFSNVASRFLIDTLCGLHDIPLLVLHDFDVSGFGIQQTLRQSTERYWFEHDIDVRDIGLRLADVEKYQLQGEPVFHRRKFSTAGMTSKEAAFLARQRVELNAFASDQLIEFVESKLRSCGVKKIVPDADTLADAYKRAVHTSHLERAIDRAAEEARKQAEDTKIPRSLRRTVSAVLAAAPELSWDAVIRKTANQGRSNGDSRPESQAQNDSRPDVRNKEVCHEN